ncbi:unnamed protein product [Vicia faba]|uniref:Uncharacterized protein n=1 Tax=Vicia faba TaxID=3906 RepID=A0AAV1ASB7_VICFA|nr:unnamed protein product [Vicia faba]
MLHSLELLIHNNACKNKFSATFLYTNNSMGYTRLDETYMSMENHFQKWDKEYHAMRIIIRIITKEYQATPKYGSVCFVHVHQLSMQEYSVKNTMVFEEIRAAYSPTCKSRIFWNH